MCVCVTLASNHCPEVREEGGFSCKGLDGEGLISIKVRDGKQLGYTVENYTTKRMRHSYFGRNTKKKTFQLEAFINVLLRVTVH